MITNLFGELVDLSVDPPPLENRIACKFRLGRGPDGERCGTCSRRIRKTWDKVYWKCEFWDSNSSASDIRLKWPACGRWKP